MRIGVLSDTHGDTLHTQEAARLFQEHGVERLIHCGDIGSEAIPSLLAEWHTDYVFGNVDTRCAELQMSIEGCGQGCHGEFADLTYDGVRIAVLHGHDARRLEQTVRSGQWHLVCHGHTHRKRWEQVGVTWVLNPGAIYHAKPRSIAVVELPDLVVQFIDLPE
ncbi:MAG: phosphodiesterase [Pirellulaceae bacterium]|nr:MAG: phosphodiesterase [Pirellulaceae bacterium]